MVEFGAKRDPLGIADKVDEIIAESDRWTSSPEGQEYIRQAIMFAEREADEFDRATYLDPAILRRWVGYSVRLPAFPR